MSKLNRAYISPLTTEDIISEFDSREPGFAARVQARVEQLEVARRVRALREKRGLTQGQLAERAGTGQAAIARIESGRTVPKLDLLSRIAGALGARLDVRLVATRT